MWVKSSLLLEAGGSRIRVQGYCLGAHVFFGFCFFCLYARATSRRLEPIWCAVAWQQNVSHCSESLSSGWCVTSCGGGGGAVCMALYAQVHLCATYLHSWIASPVWFVMYVSEGIRAYCSWRICVWVHSYVCSFKMIVFRRVTRSTFYTCGVICSARSVHKCDYVSVYRVLRVAGMHYLVLLSHVCATKCWLSTMRNIYIVGNLSHFVSRKT